jgi:hypothetical protein
MSFKDEWKGREEQEHAGIHGGPMEEAELETVLRDFRTSVRAWSDAVYQRPRLVEATARRKGWRQAAAWALGSVLVIGGASWGGLLEHQHRHEQDRLARLRQQEVDRRVQEEKAREAEQELAKVDSAVSREVPDALAPLVPATASDDGQ